MIPFDSVREFLLKLACQSISIAGNGPLDCQRLQVSSVFINKIQTDKLELSVLHNIHPSLTFSAISARQS